MKALVWLLAGAFLGIAFLSQAAATKTILAVFAHPDDELFIAPLVSAYSRQGVRVQLVVVTRGERGARSHAGIPAGPQLARAREMEVHCSCRALGANPPIVLSFKDGELGSISRPPWGYLAQVELELRALFARIRPDVVITFGPEGAYGHPDHRLVGAVVTQLVQAGVEGAPAILLYPGTPRDRVQKPGEWALPWAPTDPRFLSVRVPYDDADLKATRAAVACHKSQFVPSDADAITRWMHQTLGGHVYLRPWFGAASADDVFKVRIP